LARRWRLKAETVAAALPGGFLFINSGLISNVQTEAELAGVMAHEIAHLTVITNGASHPTEFLGCFRFATRELTPLAWRSASHILPAPAMTRTASWIFSNECNLPSSTWRRREQKSVNYPPRGGTLS
jgi:hypothetical protein